MLNNIKKINFLKKILYRENIKKKHINNFKTVYKNNIYIEKVTFLYKNKELIQIIEFSKKEKSLFLLDDNLKINQNGIKHFSHKKQSKLELNYDNTFKKRNKKNSVNSENIGNTNTQIINNTNEEKKESNKKLLEYNKNEKNDFLIKKSEQNCKQKLNNNESIYEICNNFTYDKKKKVSNKKYNNPSDISIKKKNFNTVKKYMESFEKNENKKSKLVIKYEMNNVNNLTVILSKCQQYNYVNSNLFDDICNYVYKKEVIELKKLIIITNIFIKLDYFNNEYFNYLFLVFLNMHSISNKDLISMIGVFSNLKNINTYNVLCLYKFNFIILHRLYTFSLYQLYNILNSYLKIYKNINKLEENVKNRDERHIEFDSNLIHKKYSNDNQNNKINSESFKIFYKVNFEKKKKNKKNSIDFIFFLIECLKKKKIVIGNINRFINIYDCLNIFFFSYIKNKIGCFFLKKVKSEYVIFNRKERKNLYKKRDDILRKYQIENESKINQINYSKTSKSNIKDNNNNNNNYINKNNVLIDNIGNEIKNKLSNLNSSNLNDKLNKYNIKNSEIIQLKLIKKMKKKLNARIFIPFIKIYDNINCNDNNKLFDFFYYTYKYMNLKFDEKSLLITLSCFSKKSKILNDEILYMLTLLIEKKINYFNHEQIVDIMNSFSNIKNNKISNNILNFLIRFLYNNNKIIYLKDKQIKILLNTLIKKKYFINEDAVHFISNFFVNHKPHYKNLDNIYHYFFFHFHFNKLSHDFLNSLYCTLLNKNNIKFEELNKILSSTIIISNNLKYQKEIFRLINSSTLSILKKIYKNSLDLKELNNMVDFISYINGLITCNVYKNFYSNIKKKIISNKKNTIFIDSVSKYNGIKKIYNNSIENNKKNYIFFLRNNYSNKRKLLYYYSHNSYNKIYFLVFSFDLRIFILIKKIFEKFLKQENSVSIKNEIIIPLIKTLSNLHELQIKTLKIRKSYTYFYINKKLKCRKNKITNNYFLKIIKDINQNILLFLNTKSEENIFFCNFYMLKNYYIFNYLNREKTIHLYLQKKIHQLKNNKITTNNFILWMNFLSSYKIDEIILDKNCLRIRENSSQNEERKNLDEIEKSLIKSFLECQKSKYFEETREQLFSIIYDEKKKKKSSLKNVIKNFFLTYKYKGYNYLEKFRYKNNLYINKIFINLERKMIKRRIKKFDDMIKLNNSFKNINKYNKFLICKFTRTWKKKKKYLIMKSTNKSGYIEPNNLIELLFSTIIISVRYFINNQFKKIDSSIYEKLIIFILDKMILLKKPKIINLNYHLYIKFILCINSLKYVFFKLFKNYFHILMYWKNIMSKNIGDKKTFKNYFDYTQSEQINQNEKLNLLSLSINDKKKKDIEGSSSLINKNNKLECHKSYINLLNFPCISQTRYKYKLKNKFSFEDNYFFKNYSFYKNIIHHNIYEEYSYLQNSSHKLYLSFIYLKMRLMKKKNEKKKKKKKFKDKFKLKKKMNSVLFKNNIKIVNVNKIELFHNHIIMVEFYEGICTNIKTIFFFLYSYFNLSSLVKNKKNINPIEGGEQTFFKSEMALNLFLVQIILSRKFLKEINLIPVCSDKLNNIQNKNDLYQYLSKLLR
ncbi:conserved Plasmodium protein, unknown function [Plasmodium gallinaceum]|uniref:Uncharacterized protein n=1 Tax=Plasmodium gallinaceum TaxID=5849 RepID=A0A1J1GR86_PLAGA|nr:conserved Plasmodium protein, unknown function [Plasmodium gallinaceum]CRG93554.1 conserved Plasmodium protein, unknown function [Plasmodium gallinaceum]